MVLVHGFTQTLRSWRQVADRLTADHRVVSVDLPGHGGSGELRGDLTTTAAALGTAGGRATYVGYSMGGRVVLRLALDRPDLVERMVLIGATAGIDSPSDRKARRVADERLASAIEQDGVPRFLVRWLSQPIFAGLSVNEEDRQARLTNSAPGLAASLRDSGTGTMDPPWWDELRRIRCPTRIVAGEREREVHRPWPSNGGAHCRCRPGGGRRGRPCRSARGPRGGGRARPRLHAVPLRRSTELISTFRRPTDRSSQTCPEPRTQAPSR